MKLQSSQERGQAKKGAWEGNSNIVDEFLAKNYLKDPSLTKAWESLKDNRFGSKKIKIISERDNPVLEQSPQ